MHTPISKIIRPNPNIFDSAEKRSPLFDDFLNQKGTPQTPSKINKTKLMLNIDVSKCPFPEIIDKDRQESLLPSSLENIGTTEASYFKIFPDVSFIDLPQAPNQVEYIPQWLHENLRDRIKLGFGSFSEVYRVSLRLNGLVFALKIAKDSSSNSLKIFRKEILNLWKVKGCKNCIQIYLGWEDYKGIYILTQHYPLT